MWPDIGDDLRVDADGEIPTGDEAVDVVQAHERIAPRFDDAAQDGRVLKLAGEVILRLARVRGGDEHRRGRWQRDAERRSARDGRRPASSGCCPKITSPDIESTLSQSRYHCRARIGAPVASVSAPPGQASRACAPAAPTDSVIVLPSPSSERTAAEGSSAPACTTTVQVQGASGSRTGPFSMMPGPEPRLLRPPLEAPVEAPRQVLET